MYDCAERAWCAAHTSHSVLRAIIPSHQLRSGHLCNIKSLSASAFCVIVIPHHLACAENEILGDGACALAHALETNSTLVTLDISIARCTRACAGCEATAHAKICGSYC